MATLQIQTMTTATVEEWHITADYFFLSVAPFTPYTFAVQKHCKCFSV